MRRLKWHDWSEWIGAVCGAGTPHTGGRGRTADLHLYLNAVDEAFNRDIDYAMLVKMYGNAPEAEKRYSCRNSGRSRARSAVRVKSAETPAAGTGGLSNAGNQRG